MSRQIPLTKGQVAIVDDVDYEKAAIYSWYATFKSKTWYAARRESRLLGHRIVYLHHMILPVPRGMRIDHIDGNGLNCTRQNLRVCTHAENLRNRQAAKNNKSGFKGVCWNKAMKKWHAQISDGRRNTSIGFFDSPEDAALAYDQAAIRLHGKFARGNGISAKRDGVKNG